MIGLCGKSFIANISKAIAAANRIRKRLDAIKLLWEGHSRYAICDENLHYAVLSSWIKMYLKPDIAQERLAKNTKKEYLSPTYKALFN